MNPAADPQPLEDVQGDDRWMSQHNRFLFETKEREPEVVFIGDSLIQNIARIELWNKMFEPLHCVNFGMGGDQTQHVLWRVQNGEMDNVEPKVVVLLVGTNNHGHTAKQVTGGILAIVDAIKLKQPNAHIIVMGIPPRGEHPNKLRDKIAEINKDVGEQLDGVSNCTFLATDPALFINSEGRISPNYMYDFLHFTSHGYQKLCEPLLDLLQDLLQNFVKVENTSQDSDSLAGDLATKVP